MKANPMTYLVAGCVAASLGTAAALAQTTAATAEAHRAAAKKAAGSDHPSIYRTLCESMAAAPQQAQTPAPAPTPREVPARTEWYREPVKVFDNLYWVGQSEYSAWAVNTSDGIILIDTIFGYSVEAEVVDGLKKLGLDPTKIKYAIVSHGHGDHSGGAKYLQDRFGTRIIMGGPDWDLVERNTRGDPKPKRDMVATDGQKLTLGDTTLTLHLTPGHTPATISTLIPVKDGGTPHVAAEWGGTGFNFTITPDKPRLFWFKTYISSAERFRDIVTKAGADVLISNHTGLDSSTTKLPALAKRKPGGPHPYVIGRDAVQRYLTVAAECAKASLATLGG